MMIYWGTASAEKDGRREVVMLCGNTALTHDAARAVWRWMKYERGDARLSLDKEEVGDDCADFGFEGADEMPWK